VVGAGERSQSHLLLLLSNVHMNLRVLVPEILHIRHLALCLAGGKSPAMEDMEWIITETS
jgi:hypothetical protein